MRLHKYIAYMLAAAVAAAGLTACDEEPELPPVNAPSIDPSIKANTSILDLKTTYWSNDRNYADTVGLTPGGEHVIIAGRVISCDSTGNIYKSLIIQDATAAMAISLDSTKIFQRYPMGEEVYIDMTGMNVGKYNGLFQMGKPNPYNDTYEISFMPYWKFNSVAMRNGLPDVTKVDTVYTSIERIKSWTSQDSVIRYQSQLICLKDVEFVGGGKLTWADNGANVNRVLRDSLGNTVTVRNSGYASFGRDVMPAGTGTVVCILSYYGTGWQILFRSALDCHDFTGIVTPDTPDTPDTPVDGEAVFRKAGKITSGKQYVIVASGKMGLPLGKTSTYGYINTSDITVDGESLKTSTDNAFTFTAVEGGYAMTDSQGRYYYMTGTYNSFNVNKSTKDGYVWTISPQNDGTMVVTNVAMKKTIQYDPQFGSYGAYSDVRGEYPIFYEIVE